MLHNTHINPISPSLSASIIGWQEEKNEEYKGNKIDKLADAIMTELISLIPNPNGYVNLIRSIENFVENNSYENPLYQVMTRTFLRPVRNGNNYFHLAHLVAENGTLEEFEYCIKYNANLNEKSYIRLYHAKEEKTVALYALSNNRVDMLKRLYAFGINLHAATEMDKIIADTDTFVERGLYYPLENNLDISRETFEVMIEHDTVKSIPRLSKILMLMECLWFDSHWYFTKKQIERAIHVLEHYGLGDVETDLKLILSTLDAQINLIEKLPTPNPVFALINGELFENKLRRFRNYQFTVSEIYYLKGLITSSILEKKVHYAPLIADLSLTTEKSRTYFLDAAGNGSAPACIRMGDMLWQENKKIEALDWYQLAMDAANNSILKTLGIKKTIELLKKLPMGHVVFSTCLNSVIKSLQDERKYLSPRQLKEFSFLLLQAPEDADSEMRSRLAMKLACDAFYEVSALGNKKMLLEAGLCIEACFKTFLRDIHKKYAETNDILARMTLYVVENDNQNLQINPCIYLICLCLAEIYKDQEKVIGWYQFIANLPGILDYIPQLLKTHYKTPELQSQDEKDSVVPAQNFLRYATNPKNPIQFQKEEIPKIKSAKISLKEPVENEEKEMKQTFPTETLTIKDHAVIGDVKDYVAKLTATRAGLFLTAIRQIPMPVLATVPRVVGLN